MIKRSDGTEQRFLVRWGITLLAVVAAIVPFSVTLVGQTPALQITSPSDGSIVNPGQTISVAVSSPSNTAFKQVFVIGEQPLPTTTLATSAPASFSILIPQGTRPGKYMLTAWGTTTANQVQASAPITVDVERMDLPTNLTANKTQVTFRSQGQKAPLRISGKFADGSVVDLTMSSNLAYTSSNTSVATVDNNGVVTAVAAGNASITATYGQGAQSVHVSVPVTVPPPVLTPSPTALSFNGQNVGTSSSPQTLTITNVSSNQGLRVGSVSAMGDFSETDNCASSSPIAVGGMCTINVTFTPASAGNRAGAVSIPDSMDIVPLAIPLSGTGIAPPSISSLSPTSGPVGTPVTITGANFGATQGSSTVTFNGTAATPTSWSANSIVAPVPSGGTTGNVVVAVGGVASNGVSFKVSSIAYVQGNSGSQSSSQTTVAASFSSSPSVGDLNVVVVACYEGCTVSSVTDTRGNTYALAVGPTTVTNGTTIVQMMYYAKNIASAAANGNTVTVTFKKATSSAELRIAEYSGLNAANPLDVTAAGTGNGTMLAFPEGCGPVATTNAHDLLVAAETSNMIATTAGNGYTSRIITPSNANLLEDEEVATAGSHEATAPLQARSGTTVLLYVFQMVALRASN